MEQIGGCLMYNVNISKMYFVIHASFKPFLNLYLQPYYLLDDYYKFILFWVKKHVLLFFWLTLDIFGDLVEKSMLDLSTYFHDLTNTFCDSTGIYKTRMCPNYFRTRNTKIKTLCLSIRDSECGYEEEKVNCSIILVLF